MDIAETEIRARSFADLLQEEIRESQSQIDAPIEEEQHAGHNEGSNVILCAANIANNIVGGGIITLSLAVKDSGLGIGIIMLALSAIACGWTIMLMGMLGHLHNTLTYEKTVQKILGKVGYVLIIMCTFIFPMTGAMSYAVAMADNLQIFFEGVAFHTKELQIRAVVLSIPFFLIIFPLSLPGNLKFLDKFSALSIVLSATYVISIVYKAFTIPYEIQSAPDAYLFGKSNAIKALPVYAFACSCHHNAMSFYKSLKDRSVMRFKLSKDIAIIFALIVYIIVAVTGYITFGGLPFGNIFKNYCPDDTFMNIIRMIFVVTLILTAPMQIFASREVLVRECFSKYKKHNKWIRPLITFILVAICFVIGSLVDNLSIVVELGSAISNVPIVYIFPALCVLRVYGKPYYPLDIKRLAAWFVLLFGILMLIAGPVFTIIDAVNNISVPPIPKYYCKIRS